nr:YceD family protein [Hydrogenophaga flava]
MKASPHRSWNPRRFDARAFAEASGVLENEDPLVSFDRLSAEVHAGGETGALVRWSAQGGVRPDAAGQSSVWMHLRAALDLPVGCQRCLGPVLVPLEVDRWFRFVADESRAEAEDDQSEEDVLALEPKPDLLALIEDELLMAIPLVPMHDVCPQPLPLSAGRVSGDEAASEARPNPFATLSGLKK